MVCFSGLLAQAQPSQELIEADSLFNSRRYTESLPIYEKIYRSGYYTPRMLIRLSLIQEGLGDYTMALYYLEVYYSKIPDREVLKKMDELASHYNLDGYDYNDLVFFVSLYKEYHDYIVIIFLIVSLFFLVYIFFKKQRGYNVALRAFFFMIILGAIYVLSNYDIIPPKAIVNKDAAMMSAPSAGAERIGQINKGHQVTVRSRQDIWCKVSWQGETAYIRENNLLFVE